ncbi:MAG: ATPase, T2SS/T4P/T4SS family [Rothia sp. (in: high G+C Gram-positive bacteria)]|uniref:CpaF family protein n=1 Tax=Rothia sp. (in: high G+C Gram-positive bacteria) TaxID=1885016 RepID=UPI0026DEE55A|nr:ATPase, T2SS/T4P/T4SS family [Rothia sp. (in: high G+C Gram-positive bacteria)]MDO5749881.1 ATPase, T2SS/T4P/T4SS family [Rothia sp. (in: high G+C Gram-positive bacteria)]
MKENTKARRGAKLFGRVLTSPVRTPPQNAVSALNTASEQSVELTQGQQNLPLWKPPVPTLAIPEDYAMRTLALSACAALMRERSPLLTHAMSELQAYDHVLAQCYQQLERDISSGPLGAMNLDIARAYLHSELHGMGALDTLCHLPGLSDIYVNSPTDIWVQCSGITRRTSLSLGSEERVQSLASRLLRRHGVSLDAAHPSGEIIDPSGRRIHAVIPPLSERTLLSIRLPGTVRPSFEQLQRSGMFDERCAHLLKDMVDRRLSFVISGGTGTGKTTLLNALLALCPPQQRLLLLEDSPELAPAHPHAVSLHARSANSEGRGAVDLGQLLVQALRMGPDRLVMGECRGAEIVHLFNAMNTGHRGAGTTLHTNSAQAVPLRFQALGALAALPRETVDMHALTAFERIIHLEQGRDGKRRVQGIYALGMDKSRCLEVVPVYIPGASQLNSADESAQRGESNG